MSADIHVLVVGDTCGPDDVIDCAFKKAVATDTFRPVRCQTAAELVQVVASTLAAAERIATLDLYDHGAPGIQNMGGQTKEFRLFDFRGTGFEIAEQLAPYLTETGNLRLLGCDTANDENGRTLLRGLRERLGGERVVWGTIRHIRCPAFNEGGFDPLYAEFLASSDQVADQVAPSWKSRIARIAAVAGEPLALSLQEELSRIESQLQNPETDLAWCCAR